MGNNTKAKSQSFDIKAYLGQLGGDPLAARPTLPVKVLLLEAERARKAADAHASMLKKLPGFDGALLRHLPKAIDVLEAAERDWSRARFAKPGRSRKSAREEAEKLRSATMTAGRYLLRKDATAQTELDRIAEGEGLADLIQDLRDLGELTTVYVKVFSLDRRLPKDLSKQLRALSEELRGTPLKDDDGAQAARNLAAVALETMLVEIRAGARYLFADQPKKLAPFLSQYEAQKKQRERSRKKADDAAGQPQPAA